MSEFRPPLGASIPFCKPDFDKKLATIKAEGYEWFDFDICCNKISKAVYYPHLNEGVSAVLASGMRVNAIHIAFGTEWDPSERFGFKRRKAVARIIDAIRQTAAVNSRCYVLHGSFEPIIPRQRQKRLNALLSALPEICAATDKTICLEILPRTCLLNTAKEAAYVIDTANIPNLKLCVDVNHLLQEKTEDAIRALGDRIYTLHVSDHDYVNERHWMPGKGKIDWNAVIGALDSVGYNGIFNYEVDDPDFHAIKQNYNDLFDEYAATK